MLLHLSMDEILEWLCAGRDDRRKESPSPRVALVVAHPDDEVIGAGGRLSHWQDCHIIYVTDGAPQNSLDAAAAGFGTREDLQGHA